MNLTVDVGGYYIDELGRKYVKCMADPTKPIYIDVSGPRIQAEWRDQMHWVDLSSYHLPDEVLQAVRSYLEFKLMKGCPYNLYQVRAMLTGLNKLWNREWRNFSSLTTVEVVAFHNSLSVPARAAFRGVYKFCVQNKIAGANEVSAVELSFTRLVPHAAQSRIVLEWDATRGALTSSEQEVVRRAFKSKCDNESIADKLARIFIWISFETLKRPRQLAEMSNDALWCPDLSSEDGQYFLKIPKIKYQTGMQPGLWPITAALALEILEYSSIPSIAHQQLDSGRLLVIDRPVKKIAFLNRIKKWCIRKNIVSPRTKQRLKLTPYRIRHSGATQMAMQGVSRDDIQYILEHDSPQTVQTYIDSLASDLCPLLDRVDRKLGNIFSDLNNIFFTGGLSSKIEGVPILIPAVQQPAVVGGCSNAGVCGKHPFFNCYNGCRYFIAWRQADHQKSLLFIESELLRWNRAESGNQRSKVIKDLEGAYQAIKDVISRIEGGKNESVDGSQQL